MSNVEKENIFMKSSKFTLKPFPLSTHSQKFSSSGQVNFLPNEINCSLTLSGPIHEINIREQNAKPEKREGIWESTCFELFIADEDNKHYLEWNFCPSGDWWCMEFRDYRDPKEDFRWEQSPVIEVKQDIDSLTMIAQFKLPEHYQEKKLSLGVTAVIDHPQGEKSYWALSHPEDKPDFHDSGHFLLKP